MPDPRVVDADALERLLRIGGQPFLLEMIELFLENAPERLSAARRALEEGDGPALYRAAHSLKSTAGNLGAQRLQAVAERLEARAAAVGATAGGPAEGAGGGDALRPLLDELDGCYAQVRERLETERRRRGGDQ